MRRVCVRCRQAFLVPRWTREGRTYWAPVTWCLRCRQAARAVRAPRPVPKVEWVTVGREPEGASE